MTRTCATARRNSAIDDAFGEGRTVYGLTGQGALDQIAVWWQHVEKSRIHTESPQTRHQRTFVRRWAEPRRH